MPSLELVRPKVWRRLGVRGETILDRDDWREGDKGDAVGGTVEEATKLRGLDSRLL